MTNFTAVGGRSFLLALLTGAAATALQWFGKLDSSGGAYGAIIIGIVGAYITGSTAQHFRKDKDAP